MIRVRCAVCNKPVESMLVCDELEQGGKMIWVRCHGASDAMFLPLFALHERDEVRQIQQQEGVAFRVARLGE